MLSEKYRQMYEGMVAEFDKAVHNNIRITATQAASKLGYNAQNVANMVRKIRVLNMKSMVTRYEAAAAAARGTIKDGPKNRGQIRMLAAVPQPKAITRVRKRKTPIEIYDAVQVKMLEMNGCTDEFACSMLGIDYGEYLSAKISVMGEPKEAKPAPVSIQKAVSQGVRDVIEDMQISRLPALVDVGSSTTLLSQLIGFLSPIEPNQRKRLIRTVAEFFETT
jgi:hypothetical protein